MCVKVHTLNHHARASFIFRSFLAGLCADKGGVRLWFFEPREKSGLQPYLPNGAEFSKDVVHLVRRDVEG